MIHTLTRPANAALIAAAVMFAALAGAWYFQYGLGYIPCPLCYEQRIPYYVAIPLGLAIAALAHWGFSNKLVKTGLWLLALVLVVSASMGVYHAGVEWGFWKGPTSCAGTGAPSVAPIGDLLKAIQNVKVVSCTDAAWRLFGISLAGYNALISAAMALLVLLAVRRKA